MMHLLKISENYFKDIVSGTKTFEVRNNDRNFIVGDFLALNDKNYCKNGYVVLGIKLL